MAVALSMDHNANRAVTDGLRLRGVDVLTAHQDGTHEAEDPELLARAAALGRVLFSTDAELRELSEAPLAEQIAKLEKEMRAHAKRPEFEEAALLRDQIKELKELQI